MDYRPSVSVCVYTCVCVHLCVCVLWKVCLCAFNLLCCSSLEAHESSDKVQRESQ